MLLDNSLIIQDNGYISIGTIIRYFAPDIIDSTMPDNIPLLKLRFSHKVVKSQSNYRILKIDNNITAKEPNAFCLNDCIITSTFLALKTLDVQDIYVTNNKY